MPQEPTAENDRDLLTGLGPRLRFQAGAALGGASDTPDTVLLLTGGSVHLGVETAFGRHRFGILEAPTLLRLHQSLNGTPCPSVIESVAESEAVELSAAQVQDLLASPSREGQAFRRLALAGITPIIRLANQSITKMFDVDTVELSFALIERLKDVSQTQRPVPVRNTQFRKILEASGLGFEDLPKAGLTARQVDAESFLVQAGSRGTEAFLLAEGRLRISLPIPRVGDEALAIVDPGQFVGEMALIDDEPRSADVTAHQGPALVYVLSRVVFRYLLNSGPATGTPLLAGLAIALSRRADEALQRLVAFKVLAGEF